LAAKEIRDDEICTHLDQPLPLPLVHDSAFRFIRRHTDCDTTGIFDVLDFNVSVAESNQLFPAALHGRNHLADENLLRKALVIVQGAENAAVKILLDFQ